MNPNSLITRHTVHIKVIGVGGGGGKAVQQMAQEGFPGVSFAVLNCDAHGLDATPLADRHLIGKRLMRGLGTGGDPELGRAAAEEDTETIKSLCEGAGIVVIVAGLGGGAGTGAAPVVARIARESGCLVLGIVTLPFECEGGRRQRQAQLGLQHLQEEADGLICLPNQKMLRMFDDQTSLIETFNLTNGYLAQGLRGLWRLLTRPGLINIDFSDLCSVTRGRHAQSILATARGSGESRAREVVEKLMQHPLLDQGHALAESDAVLISLVGGTDLTIAEINKVMEQINRQCEQAQVVMGAAVDDSFAGQLEAIVIVSRDVRAGTPDPAASEQRGFSTRVEELSGQQQFLENKETPRPPSRFVAPPPEMSQEKTQQLFTRQGTGSRHKKKPNRLQQGQLKLEIVSKGRFEKSEPTIRHGEDLDVPTYIRRGVALN